MTKRGGLFVLLILGLLIFTPFFRGSGVFAYQTGFSHPTLTQKAILLYNQTGVGRDISAPESSWIVTGAIEEDTFPRYISHFWDPVYNRQWVSGFNIFSEITPAWARDVFNQSISPKGNQTWQKAIEAYAEGDLESSFVALGHILHLIEDMAVPEHTRNDTHIPRVNESFYEDWVEKNTGKLKSSQEGIARYKSLENYFYSLAVFSNQNFFSRDTVENHEYLNPVIGECPSELESALLNGEKFYYKCRSINNKSFRLIQFKKEINWLFKETKKYAFDEAVLSDYFSVLGPKAVSHAAGLIDLFFEEAERARVEYEKKAWWQKLNPFASLLPEPDSQPDPVNTSFRATEENNQPEPENTDDREIKAASVSSVPKPPAPVPKIIEQNPPQPKFQETKNTQKEPETPPNQNPSTEPEDDRRDEENPQEEAAGSTSGVDSPFHSAGEAPLQGGTGGEGPDENYPEENQDEENQEQDQGQQEQNEEESTDQSVIQVKIDRAPAKTVSATFAVFEFSASAASASFQCRLDENEYEDCLASKTYNDLNEGEHLFFVYAIDPQTNEISRTVSHTWTVDLSGPQAGNIQTQNITKDSAQISFETGEPAKFEINWGENLLYDQTTSQSLEFAASHTYQLTGLKDESEYHYQIITQDELGNAASSADNSFETAPAKADHIVISEVQVAGSGGTDDEWIELYNPTERVVDISGWSVQYRGPSAQGYSRKNFETGAVIPAGGFYLITHDQYLGLVEEDMNHNSFSMAGSGGSIFLVNNQTDLTASDTFEAVVDRLAYGEGKNLFPETVEFTPAPSSGQSLERKANKNSTAESLNFGTDKYQGNAFDTDDNSQDFVLQVNPVPQNSVSLLEPREAFEIEWSDKQELDAGSANYPEIVSVSPQEQEVIWQKGSSDRISLYGKKKEDGTWSQNRNLISQGETEQKLAGARDSKIAENQGRIFSFFIAEPVSSGQKTLFVSEKIGEDWGAPVFVSLMYPGYQNWDLAMGGAGEVHLVWQDNYGGDARYQKCVLETTPSCQDYQSLNQVNVTNLSLVLDANTVPHLFYHRVNEKDIRERTLDENVWTDSLVLQTNKLSSGYAMFAVGSDEAGDFHLVFTQERGRDANLWDYFYLKKSGNVWLEKEKIEEGMGMRDGLDIVADATVVFVLSVNHRTNIKPSRELNLWKRENGAWLAPQKFSKESEAEEQLWGDLTTDGEGGVYVVWKSTVEPNISDKIWYIKGV